MDSCVLCGREFGSRVRVFGRTRYLVETYVIDEGEKIPACQVCERERDPLAARRSANLERDVAARVRAKVQAAMPPSRLGSRSHRRPGRPVLPDGWGLDTIPPPDKE